jgi:hypothetical protein
MTLESLELPLRPHAPCCDCCEGLLFTAFDHDDVVAMTGLDFSIFGVAGCAGLQVVGYFLKLSVK